MDMVFNTKLTYKKYGENMKDFLSKKLEDNFSVLNDKFLECPDIKRQRILLKDATPILIIYCEGLTDINLLQRDIIPKLLELKSTELFDENMQTVRLPAASLSLVNEFDTLISDILNGKTVIFINGFDIAISLSVIRVEKRSISEPTIEKDVKGAQEAFIESINTNISILRRKIKNERLKFKTLILGDITNQSVALVYIEGIANPEIVETMFNKIKGIQFDGLLGVGYIEQLIADNQITPFPHYLTTERPDKVVSCLLEGQLAILLDGTPFALIAPDDMALTIRYIRFIVMFFASIFGIIGVVICGVFILAHLVILESLGEPYFKPMFPFNQSDFKDILLRPQLKSLRKRPSLASPIDKTRGKKR